MIQYFLFGKENYALTRHAVLLGSRLEIVLDGAAEAGELLVGSYRLPVRGGRCAFPASYLSEGENCLIYSEGKGREMKRFALEPLHRWGEMAGVKPLDADKTALSLLAHIRYLKGALAHMEARVKKLEACCFAAPLFESENKGEKNA